MIQVSVPANIIEKPECAHYLVSDKPDCGTFVAGGTRNHLKDWKLITHDPNILSYTQGVRIDFINWPEQGEEPVEFRHSKLSRDLIAKEIEVLSKKGVIELAEESEGQYLSNIFIRPKPNGKVTVIIDLSDLDVLWVHWICQTHTFRSPFMKMSGSSYDLGGGGGPLPIHLFAKWLGTSTKEIYRIVKTRVCQPPKGLVLATLMTCSSWEKHLRVV